MGSPLASPRHLFLDPLVEDLALLVSLASLGEDLALPVVAASVVEVVEVVLDLVLAGSRGENTCCWYRVAWVASCLTEAASCWMTD